MSASLTYSQTNQEQFILPTKKGEYYEIKRMKVRILREAEGSPVLTLNSSESVLKEFSATVKIASNFFEVYIYKNGELFKAALHKEGSVVFKKEPSSNKDLQAPDYEFTYEYKRGEDFSIRFTYSYDTFLGESCSLIYFDDANFVLGASTL